MTEALCAPGPLSLAAAFTAGIAGSVHCLAMCGGLSGALGLRAQRAGGPATRTLMHQLLPQLGRVTSYALAGAVFGAFGATLAAQFDITAAARVLRILAGLCLLAIAARVLWGWQPLAPLERLGARMFAHLTPLLRTRGEPTSGGSFLLGILWGWMPCGLVYSMLLFAAVSGGAVHGALMLALFGAGTWPSMLGGSLLSRQLGHWSAARGLHAVTGIALLAFGVLTLLAPLAPVHH